MKLWKALAALAATATAAVGFVQIPAQATGWTIDVNVDKSLMWVTEFATVTVTAGQSVTGTGLVISIFDNDAGKYIKICNMGTTCAVPVTKDNPVQDWFLGTVSLPPVANAFPPPGEQNWGHAPAVWTRWDTTLSPSATNVSLGSSVTLTATTGHTVSFTNFWIQIYDITAGVRLNSCSGGNTCSISTSQSVATTHKFMAYVGNSSTTAPPPKTQSTSPPSFVTWGTDWTLTLTGPTVTDGPATITATANKSVTTTPYYILIFNLSNGTQIGFCPTGTTCTISYNVPGLESNWFGAFVSANSTALPPASTQASSNTISIYNEPPH